MVRLKMLGSSTTSNVKLQHNPTVQSQCLEDRSHMILNLAIHSSLFIAQKERWDKCDTTVSKMCLTFDYSLRQINHISPLIKLPED